MTVPVLEYDTIAATQFPRVVENWKYLLLVSYIDNAVPENTKWTLLREASISCSNR